MSRLIIKNLPSYVTPSSLQDHFQSKTGPGGTLTDVKVALKPDGTSRRFGFVGFKTEMEADAAKEWFDRTFIGSSRISVGVVEGTKNAPAPRPNKRPRLGPSPTDEPKAAPALSSCEQKTKKAKLDGKTSKAKPSTQLDEYMQVMQPRTKKGPLWVNDSSAQTQPSSIGNVRTSRVEFIETIGKGDEQKDEAQNETVDKEGEGISDLDWMKRRMKENLESVERVFEQSDDDDEITSPEVQRAFKLPPEPNVQPPQQKAEQHLEHEDPTKQTILQTCRLFLRNLAFSCTDHDLLELFQPFGEVTQVHIPLDPSTKQSKGLAYVTFAQPSCAFAAYETLDRRSFQGRLLHVLAAVDRKGSVRAEEGDGKKKTVKDEREGKRKAMAGREFNWGMLYMNSDAVASSIADRMNISKSDILNPDSDNAAVKLALAETHVIQETKTYLESHGVILSSFSASSPTSNRIARSDTTILVKNIPYGTTADQIRELFEVHGELRKVLVPPAGTMGVVEFVHADEAAKAFKAVAYRRMGNAVIYLEKGPVGMFVVGKDEGVHEGDVGGVKGVMILGQEQDGEEGPPSLTAGSTLFIKNLAFSTTTDRLTQIFRNLPSFSFARVQTKSDPKRPDGPRLSMGYGFVGFKNVDAAKKAIPGMQGFVLDGHALSVKFAGRGTEEVGGERKGIHAKSRTTKMIVKNVPFEATKKDIRELFSAHGQLKSVRVPKKFDSRSRGFAFLEFVTRHEAENAYAALRHTHLLGRHLVLEWAEEAEQDLDVLRLKAGVGFGGGGEMPGKKRKLEIGGDKRGEDGDDDMS